MLAVALAAPAMAQGAKKTCDVNKVKGELSSPPAGVAAFLTAPWDSTRCSSVLSVLKMAGSTTKTGGRKLEDDKVLDLAAAEQERSKAQADPSFAAELAAELAGESDAARRVLREAAILHDHGFYKARDLLLAQLRAEKTP
ncbi:MAG: hypothetical protein Q8K96_15765 [Rubrivivax sp.]|nr:hypothetical protein [Rubrivivax sp.]